MSDECVKCGAAYREESRVGSYVKDSWYCGTWQWRNDPLGYQSDRCRIVQLETQLADARLLARALDTGRVKFMSGLVIFSGSISRTEIECDHDSDGLPLLTDELRAALVKAVGGET